MSGRQQPDHKNLKPKLNQIRQYQNYKVSGGRSDFQTWLKENKQRLTRKIVLGPHELLSFYLMTTTTEPGNRQNRFATEPQVQVIESDYFDNAERVNGQLAMLGFVAALGSYIITGQIIPGIF